MTGTEVGGQLAIGFERLGRTLWLDRLIYDLILSPSSIF